MKEAAGEANITVITIVLIAIVLAVGTIVVTNVLNNTSKQSACTSLGGTYGEKAKVVPADKLSSVGGTGIGTRKVGCYVPSKNYHYKLLKCPSSEGKGYYIKFDDTDATRIQQCSGN